MIVVCLQQSGSGDSDVCAFPYTLLTIISMAYIGGSCKINDRQMDVWNVGAKLAVLSDFSS